MKHCIVVRIDVRNCFHLF